jgi:hypothetical protein
MFVLLSLLLLPLQRVAYALRALVQPSTLPAPARNPRVLPLVTGPAAATQTAVSTAPLALVHAPAPRLSP